MNALKPWFTEMDTRSRQFLNIVATIHIRTTRIKILVIPTHTEHVEKMDLAKPYYFDGVIKLTTLIVIVLEDRNNGHLDGLGTDAA